MRLRRARAAQDHKTKVFMRMARVYHLRRRRNTLEAGRVAATRDFGETNPWPWGSWEYALWEDGWHIRVHNHSMLGDNGGPYVVPYTPYDQRNF